GLGPRPKKGREPQRGGTAHTRVAPLGLRGLAGSYPALTGWATVLRPFGAKTTQHQGFRRSMARSMGAPVAVIAVDGTGSANSITAVSQRPRRSYSIHGPGSRLRHRYQQATERYGCHGAATAVTFAGSGNFRRPNCLCTATRIP